MMRLFASFIIVLLLAEMFVPVAYAAPVSSAPAAPEAEKVSAPLTEAAGDTKKPPETPTATEGVPASAEKKEAQKTAFVGGCKIDYISEEEQKALWNYLFPNGKPFQADWLNDLSIAESLLNPETPEANLKKNMLEAEQRYMVPLEELAGLTGRTPEEAAKELKIWDSKAGKVGKSYLIDNVQKVPAAMAVPYLEKNAVDKGKGQVAIAQIQEQIKSMFSKKEQDDKVKELAKQLRPYEKFRVTLPQSANQMSLAELFAQHGIDPNSCLLKNEVMMGRVSYAAILDADLAYGADNPLLYSGNYVSPATGKSSDDLTSKRTFDLSELPESVREQLPPEVKAKGSKVESKINQFMSADKVTAYLALNGGGNIIVPEFYRDWIVFVNAWTRWDLYLSAGFAIASIGAVKNLEQAKKMKAEAAERVKVREGSMLGKAEMEARLYGDVQSQGGKILLDKPVTTPKGIADRVAISPDGKKLQYFSGSGAPLFEREGVSNLVEAEAVDSSLRFKRKGGLQADIDEADVNIMRFKQMKQSLVSRVGASYMLAGGWLGSARLLYGINEGMLFRASVGDKDSKEKDKYLRLLVNKPVMEDFRSASGILSIGRVQEVIAKYVDSGFVPEKAFFPKKQILLNYPEPSAQVKSDAPQLTGFKSTGTDFTVYSNWRGNSYTLNYEDLRNFGGHDPFTALSVVAYGIIAEPSLYKKDLKAFTLLFSLAIPFMASRRLLDLEESALGAAVFLTTLEFLQIPSDLGDPDTCDMNKMNEFKDKFRLAFAGSVAATLVSVWIPFSKATGFLKQFGVSAAKWIDWVNPSDIWKWWIGDAAIAYASNCKDQMHTILSYQKIPDAVAPAEGNVITEKLPFLQSLSLPRVLAATEEEQKYEKAIKKLSEIMNLRVVLLNQKSFFYTPELLYAHIIESELSVKTSLYDIIADGCSLPERLQSSDGRSITINEKGLNAYDENGNPVLAFQSTMWKLRSLARLRSQALAKTIIPNKIISSTLSGQGESVFLLVSGTGDSTIVTPPCNLREAIEAVTGRNIGSDFTRAVGKTKFIETDAGKVGIEGGRIYFVKEFGTAVTSPSADDLRKSISEGARVEIRNNGEVIVFGPPGGEFKQISAGTFKTLLAEDGRVEHDTSSGTISVIIYSIFKTSAQNFAGYTVSPKGKGVSISAKPKAGQEASADKLNKAIDKIAGENGLTMFETKDHIYYITPDGKLRVMDKKTGTSSEYNLTGQPYQDGNQIVIPTDSGPLRLTLSNDNGVPTLQAQGLGLDELLPLLTARGQNGILTFNPSTGAINVYNGQDIPMNPAFAEKGIGFTGNDDGSSQGVPMNNPFTQSASTGTTTDNTPKLSLPAWPTDLAALLFVMLALLGAVVAVRFREN